MGTKDGGSVSAVVLGLKVVDMRSLGLNLVGSGVEVVGNVVDATVDGALVVVVDLALPLVLMKGLRLD